MIKLGYNLHYSLTKIAMLNWSAFDLALPSLPPPHLFTLWPYLYPSLYQRLFFTLKVLSPPLKINNII